MRTLSLVVALLVVALLQACPPVEAAGDAPRDLDTLQRAVQAVLAKEKVPGAGLAVVRRESVVWAGGVGKADVARGRDVTADTHFRAGSVSKTFVAMALMTLVEEGRIDLTARLEDLAPEVDVENRWDATHPVRVVHLLEHTAGFDDMHPNEIYNLEDPPDMPLRDVLARNPRSRVVRWPPGTRMSYSNPGYAIAGYLIEKTSGKPYDAYIKEAILEPLGMAASSFRLDTAALGRLAKGYTDGSFQPTTVPNIYLRPAGALHTSPRELALFVQMLLNRGRASHKTIIGASSLARMERPETTLAAQAGLKAGYGLGLFPTLDLPAGLYGHNGGIEGFLSEYAYAPAEGFGYVILLNSVVSGRAGRQIRDIVFRFLSKRNLPRPEKAHLQPEQLRAFSGHYRQANPRNQLLAFLSFLLGGRTLFVEDGTLFQKALFEAPAALVPVSATTFRRENQTQASLVFLHTADGRDVLAGGSTYLERVNPWPSRLLLGGLGLALVLMATAPLFALVWIPRKLLGRLKGVQGLRARAVPLFAVVCLPAAFALFYSTPSLQQGAFNSRTFSFWALTWAFAWLSLWGLLLNLRAPQASMGRTVRVHSLLVSLANCGVALYLGYWGIIGLRPWAF